jgi:hypothetical protein
MPLNWRTDIQAVALATIKWSLMALGLNRESTLEYMKNDKPTYPQLEAWIRQQPGAKLDQGSITALNASINGYIHDDATRQSILSANGIEEGSSGPY